MGEISTGELVADLRARGLEGPISDDFLTAYRQGRELLDFADRIETVPGGPARFRRSLVRDGIVPPDSGADAALLAAWKAFRTAECDLAASGPDASDEVDAPFWDAWEKASEVIEFTPATTVAGAIVKLRRGLMISASAEAWVSEAMQEQDDLVLFARAEELDIDGQMIVEAIAALVMVERKSRAS